MNQNSSKVDPRHDSHKTNVQHTTYQLVGVGVVENREDYDHLKSMKIAAADQLTRSHI